MKQRKSISKPQVPTYEPAGQYTSEQLDEAIRAFTAGPTDEELEAVYRVVATVPPSPSTCTSETYRTAYWAGQTLEDVEPAAKAPRRPVRRDPCPLHETTSQRLTAKDKEPRHE